MTFLSPSAPTKTPSLPQRGVAAAPLVLVIDDNAANLAVAEGHLTSFGYRVVLASSGASGIEAFSRTNPDLVLLDVLMPEMSGVEVCQRLRAMPQGDKTPICFLTALGDLGTYESAIAAGGDDLLSKPVNRTELQLRCASLIRLRRAWVELEHKGAVVEAQNASLARLLEDKRVLVSMIVHDLKGPLSAILLASNMLRDELAESQRADVDLLVTSAERMHRMVLDILDIDGALAVRARDVDASALLQASLAQTSRVFADRRQRITVRGGGTVWADPELLRRMVDNLLDNASKYGPRDSEIVVTCDVVGGNALLRVTDLGRGIPLAERERVFEPGVRSASADASSRGLGLAFCRRAARAHGGDCYVEDAPGGAGTTFVLRLPFASAKVTPGGDSATIAADAERAAPT